MVWLAGWVEMEGATVEPGPPLPLREITCGLFGALSVRVKVPVRLPVAEGVNLTLTVQLAPGAIELPQVPVPPKPKSPVNAAEKVIVEEVLFVRVESCAELLVPIAWLPKVKEVGEMARPAVVAGLTVRVAALLVTLPAALPTVTENCAPLSEVVSAGVV